MIELSLERVEHHLGAPPGTMRRGRWASLHDAVRSWCIENAKPSVSRRQVGIDHIDGSVAHLAGGIALTGGGLAARLRAARAHALHVVALSAGHAIVAEIGRLWRDDRPDEAMALNAYGVALVEELRAREAVRLCQEMEPHGTRVLPYHSPGYPGWPLDDQARLLSLLTDYPGPIEVLESGALRPRLSTLAAFGLTRENHVTATA